MTQLTPEKALIFRIIHKDNIEKLFCDGLQSRTSQKANPDYTPIGNEEIIGRRRSKHMFLLAQVAATVITSPFILLPFPS